IAPITHRTSLPHGEEESTSYPATHGLGLAVLATSAVLLHARVADGGPEPAEDQHAKSHGVWHRRHTAPFLVHVQDTSGVLATTPCTLLRLAAPPHPAVFHKR